MTEPAYTNRLAAEKSPYLLQHAHNPVDWYPWGEDAFHAAKALDRPIFLSIGYATCHWCHVMERESFDNIELAEQLNLNFICVKVDREELPEIDALYMEFAQAMMAGSAGWPLNLALTPDLKPFFATTYVPPEDREGLTGFKEIIRRLSSAWKDQERERLLAQSEKVYDAFKEQVHTKGSTLPSTLCLQNAAEILYKLADPVYGGFKGLPKFPVGYQMQQLLRYAREEQDGRALYFVEKTLNHLARGGIYDHLGGGFSRYSVDEQWLIPHFEKMLYDNALMMEAYMEAWQTRKEPKFQKVACEIAKYLMRDMRGEEGAFYSGEDAESEDKEGFYYTWTKEEIVNILGPADSEWFCEFYGVTEEGNFNGRNVLHVSQDLTAFAGAKGVNAKELEHKLDANRHLLWTIRQRRPHPLKDDKILSGWNGLAIHSLVRLGCAMGDNDMIDAGEAAAQFIKEHLFKEGRLFRRWREHDARFKASLEDYAFVIRGLITLFEADRGSFWLEWAMDMTDILRRDFKEEEGAFYQTDGTDPHIILRRCSFVDGAEPSGNAVHCENLLRLAHLTGNDDYRVQAEDIFKAVQRMMEHYPPAYQYHLLAYQRWQAKQPPLLVIALNEKEEHREEIHQLVFHSPLLFRSVVWKHTQDTAIDRLISDAQKFPPFEGKTTLYLWEAKKEPPIPLTNLSDMIEAVLTN